MDIYQIIDTIEMNQITQKGKKKGTQKLLNFINE